MLKPIKTEAEYKAALSKIESLVGIDPDPASAQANELEVLSILVEKYESEKFPRLAPDPVTAIEFRMEQQGLTQRDLIPFIGSRSKVSEILSRKRSLTLPMIRALESGLGIPADVLVKETTEHEELDWNKFPLRIMINRGYLSATKHDIQNNAEKVLNDFFDFVGSPLELVSLHRKSDHVRSARSMDKYALAAWTTHVLKIAKKNRLHNSFSRDSIDLKFMQSLAKLSPYEDGPIRAKALLKNKGISLVIEPHLLETHLDGAAIMLDLNNPVIGLTIRYDRVDNFWFCLMHELAHISLHLGQGTRLFYDNLDVSPQDDIREKEADALAGEALIPQEDWKKSAASRTRMEAASESLAEKLGIHVAIVVGRMRYEFKSYRLFNNLVGSGQIRKQFPEVRWDK